MSEMEITLEASLTIPLKVQYSNVKPLMAAKITLDKDDPDFQKKRIEFEEGFEAMFNEFCARMAISGQASLFGIQQPLEEHADQAMADAPGRRKSKSAGNKTGGGRGRR